MAAGRSAPVQAGADGGVGRDTSVCYRDVLDLCIPILRHGGRIPEAASAKAQSASRWDVWRDAEWVVQHLGDKPGELEKAARALGMDHAMACEAVSAVAQAIKVAEAGRSM